MKTTFGFVDPSVIMGVVVSLIILGVGVYAFFVTVNTIVDTQNIMKDVDSNWSNLTTMQKNIYNSTGAIATTGNSVFNIIGIVLIIGAIMSIVGLVYNYVK